MSDTQRKPKRRKPLSDKQQRRLYQGASEVKNGNGKYMIVRREGDRLQIQTLKLDIKDTVG